MTRLDAVKPSKPGVSGTCAHGGVYAHVPDDEFDQGQWRPAARARALLVTEAVCPKYEQATVVSTIQCFPAWGAHPFDAVEEAIVAERLIWPAAPAVNVPDSVPPMFASTFWKRRRSRRFVPTSAPPYRAVACRRSSLLWGQTRRRLSSKIDEIGDRLTPELQKDLEYLKRIGTSPRTADTQGDGQHP